MQTLASSRAVRTVRPVSLFARVMGFLAISRQRNQLANLDDAALRDIGVTPSEAAKEARRLPWDVPNHWLR